MGSRIEVGVGPRSTEWGLALRVAACACVVIGIERITTAAATPARAPATSAVAPAAPAGCSFAQAGTGTFASTLCWLDLSAYNPTAASKPAGQPMTVTLPGGYTIKFNLHVSGGPVAATSFPTFSGCVPGKQRPLHRRLRAAGAGPDDARYHDHGDAGRDHGDRARRHAGDGVRVRGRGRGVDGPPRSR